jgi:hypothetical protein
MEAGGRVKLWKGIGIKKPRFSPTARQKWLLMRAEDAEDRGLDVETEVGAVAQQVGS